MSLISRITVNKSGKCSVVEFVDSAIMDTEQIQQITDELDREITLDGASNLLLDFSTVKFLSSQTLGMLLKIHNKLFQSGGSIVLCGLKKDLYKIFRLTRLDQVFTFHDTVQNAVEEFSIREK
jgi:anti-sigma B factor antagonist